MNRFVAGIFLLFVIASSGWTQSASFYDGGSHIAYGVAFSPEWALGKAITLRANFEGYILNTINTAPSYGSVYALGASIEPRVYFEPNSFNKGYLSLPIMFGRADIPYDEPLIDYVGRYCYGLSIKLGYKRITFGFNMNDSPVWIVLEPSMSYQWMFYNSDGFNDSVGSVGWLSFQLSLGFNMPIVREFRQARRQAEIVPVQTASTNISAVTNQSALSNLTLSTNRSGTNAVSSSVSTNTVR